MRHWRRCVLLTTVTGALFALLPAVGSSTEPTIDAVNAGLYEHHWSPEQVAVNTGATIAVRNATTVPHGVEWVSGPATPACTGVPVSTAVPSSGTQWSGTCTFTQAGTYKFYCTVHGPAMSGTVTVSTPGAPTATTGAASAIGQTTATLNGTVNPQGKLTKYHFDYGLTMSYGEKTSEASAGEGSTAEVVASSLSSLAPGTTYHYRLVATNAADTTEGADKTFTTQPAPGAPSASTGTVSALSETQATLNGTVNPNGQATEYHFEWGLTSSYGQSTEELPAGEDHAAHAESTALTGLVAGTVYHFRVVAKNASGTVQGVDNTFTTTSPPTSEPPPTTTTSTTTTPTPPPTGNPLPPAVLDPIVAPAPGPAIVGAPSLRSAQRGVSVKGSLNVSAAGAGGRLEVDVFAKGASLASAKAAPVLVGRYVRGAVAAGRVSFTVKLNAKGRSALRRRRSLSLTVKIALTPASGRAASVTRSVVLR